MGSSKSLKFPVCLIGLKRRKFSNFWKIPFIVRIGSLYIRWATQILKACKRAMLKLTLLNFLPEDFVIETFILH